jgi:DNA repair protein SbcD/Mre11
MNRMLVAVTADLHLTPRREHPERFLALENILARMREAALSELIIAGDLFDQEIRNVSDFEAVCRDPLNRSIRFHLLPGNHDAGLSQKAFAAENVIVHSSPEIFKADPASLPVCLMPYRNDQTMGEALAPHAAGFVPGAWILMGHGDWMEGMREPNPLEPGVYMPFTRVDLETWKPVRVILGHVHKPQDLGVLHYPGSPCGLDVTETGRRRFLVLDTESGFVQFRTIEAGPLFFDESIVMLPLEDESAYLGRVLESMVGRWGLRDSEKERAQVRIKVTGYTTDKRRLSEAIRRGLEGFRLLPDGEADLSDVSVSEDVERAQLAEHVRRQIEKMDWPSGPDAPGRDAAFLHAVKTIYEP